MVKLLTGEMLVALAHGDAASHASISAMRADSTKGFMRSNVRDQRRRAVGAPLADRNLSVPAPVPASGVPTSAECCIA
jgi:hypothetical protein